MPETARVMRCLDGYQMIQYGKGIRVREMKATKLGGAWLDVWYCNNEGLFLRGMTTILDALYRVAPSM